MYMCSPIGFMLHQYPGVIRYNLQILHTPKRPNVNASRQAHSTGASGSPLSGYFSALIRVTCCTGPQGMTATIGTYRIYVLSRLLSTVFFLVFFFFFGGGGSGKTNQVMLVPYLHTKIDYSRYKNNGRNHKI